MAEPLSRHDVSSILGRVAFGATAADLDTWTGRTQDELADHLLAVPTDPAVFGAQPDEARRASVTFAATAANEENGRAQLQAAQGWWQERMRITGWPLLERMVLFWHDHFATALGAPHPDVAMMLRQNETQRTHALGNFAELVAAMTVDPAMLHWLDGAKSITGKPNENYAREFLELFTMGVSPQQYGEQDIREAARAFTGWTVNGQRAAAFDARRHDKGVKTVLGRRIPDQGESEHLAVRDAALATPVSSRFIALKLVQNLAYDPGPIDLMADSDPLVAKIAGRLRSDWSIRGALDILLRSTELRRRTGELARHPVEQAVHACKVFDIAADAGEILLSLEGMGQRLFEPPNVGGWPRGEEWISPGTTLARYRLGTFIELEARRTSGSLPVGTRSFPPTADLGAWATLFGLPGFSPHTEGVLRGYLSSKGQADDSERLKGLITLVISSPEWTVM